PFALPCSLDQAWKVDEFYRYKAPPIYAARILRLILQVELFVDTKRYCMCVAHRGLLCGKRVVRYLGRQQGSRVKKCRLTCIRLANQPDLYHGFSTLCHYIYILLSVDVAADHRKVSHESNESS